MVEILNPPAPETGRAFHPGSDPDHRQFGFVASRPWGNFASLLLWNPADEPGSVSLDTTDLGQLGNQFHVWSFWDERYLGVCDGKFKTELLPAHGAAVLRLTALPVDKELPVLVGSTLHLSMGSAEIAEAAATKTQITIRLTDGGARSGKLIIASPRDLRLTSAQGCRVASVEKINEDVWAVALADRQRGAKQEICLEAVSKAK
jgi:hypothetical protein